MSDRHPKPADPSGERTAEGSTQTAGGLGGGRGGPEQGRRDEDTPDRAPHGAEDAPSAPRRPEDADRDPVLPTDDSSLGTKI